MNNSANPLDPQGDANRLLVRYADRLLVVQHRNHHELLSLDDNGATWSDNPARLWDWHCEVATAYAAAFAASDAAATEIRAVTGYLRRVRTRRGFERMVSAVGGAFLHMQDSGDIPSGLTVCQVEDLDRGPLYLGCANGVVDLNVGRLMPAAEGWRQLISRNTGVSFDPEARDGSVDDLLTSLLPLEREYLLAALGHALRGGRSGRWYVLWGAPGSGKSTLLRTIADALGVVQSGGYAFYVADWLMTSGRHTSTARFADHLGDFTRGRIALADGLPMGGARFNSTLIKSLTGGDLLSSRVQWGMHRVPAPVTATIFHGMLPEDVDHLDLSDHALVDRTHVLSCLPRHSRNVGTCLVSVPATDQVRRAMLALLVQHAAAYPEPPDAPVSVTGLVRERRRAAIGSVGRWLLDHLQVTGDGDDMVLADEIIAGLGEDIPPDEQARFQGKTRREILALARDLINGFPTAKRVKRGGRLLSAYPGLRVMTPNDTHIAEAALPPDPEAALPPDPEAALPPDPEIETHTTASEVGRLIVDVALEEHAPAPCVCICCGRNTEDQALKKCWECATALFIGREAAKGEDTLAIWGEPVYWVEEMGPHAAREFQRMLDTGEVPVAEALPHHLAGLMWSDVERKADTAALDAYLAQPEWTSAVAAHPVTLPALVAWIAAGHCPIQELAQSRSELDGLCGDDVGHPRWAWYPEDAPVTLLVARVNEASLTVPELLSLADQQATVSPDIAKPDPLRPLVRAYLEARGSSPLQT